MSNDTSASTWRRPNQAETFRAESDAARMESGTTAPGMTSISFRALVLSTVLSVVESAIRGLSSAGPEDPGQGEQGEDHDDQHQRARPGPGDRGLTGVADLLVDEQGRADWGSLSGSVFTESLPKAVRSSGAVSPATRAMPSTTAVMSPVRAAGSTTRITVRHSGAPSANEASRNPPGTSLSISSEVLVTVGSIKTASARPAAMPENPRPSWRTQNVKMNKPATMDGIPLMASTRNRTMRASWPPYSLMYTAVITPRGTDSTVAIATCSRVPIRAWRAPPVVAGSSGPTASRVSLKKLALKASRPFVST